MPDRNFMIEGYGAPKGTLASPDNMDWTKPIYAQLLIRKELRARPTAEMRRVGSKKVRPGIVD